MKDEFPTGSGRVDLLSQADELDAALFAAVFEDLGLEKLWFDSCRPLDKRTCMAIIINRSSIY
jgi:hypothetical protein